MAWIETVVTVLSTGAGLKFLELYVESRRKAKESDRTERKDEFELEKQRRDELKKELDETKKERDEHRKARLEAENKLLDSGRFDSVKVESVDPTLRGTGPVAPAPVVPAAPRRPTAPVAVLDEPDHHPSADHPTNSPEVLREMVLREVRLAIKQELLALRQQITTRGHVGSSLPAVIKPRGDEND